MTPRALADDTTPLLKPLSCQAIAAASEPGTPWPAAIWAISEELVCAAVGYGAACGMLCGGAVEAGAPALVGSFSARAESSGAARARPVLPASPVALRPGGAPMPGNAW